MIEVRKKSSIYTDILKFGVPEEYLEKESFEKVGAKNRPFIFINAKAVDWKSIIDLKISSTGFFPEISIIFEDQYELFTSDIAITNGDLISIYIQPPTDEIKPVRTDFYITSSKPKSNETGNTIFYLRGILHVPKIWNEKNMGFSEASSYEVLDEISQDTELGFSTNISSTDDRMNWINSYFTQKYFIEEVTQHSYKDEESFFKSFIDLYYNLNFIELNRELPQTEEFLSEDEIEETIFNIDKENTTIPNILHNIKTNAQSNISFTGSYLLDESGELSLQNGYKKIIQYYSELDREELNFEIDPLVTEGNEQSFLMKGRQDSEYYKNIKRYRYRGIEFNSSNMHSNYKFAEFLNFQNIEELNKLKLVIELDQINLSLYRYMKIPLIYGKRMSGNDFTFNKFLSGNYLIDGIEYFKDEDIMRQKIYLTRREWPYPSQK